MGVKFYFRTALGGGLQKLIPRNSTRHPRRAFHPLRLGQLTDHHRVTNTGDLGQLKVSSSQPGGHGHQQNSKLLNHKFQIVL